MPVPDSGIPREWVEAAREAIKDNAKPSANAARVWELSGGILVCGECGCRMVAHTTFHKQGGATYHYYRCANKGHMSDDDLAEALAELDETRATAERELKSIRGRKAALEEL